MTTEVFKCEGVIAPSCPEGYRFKVSLDQDRDLVIALQQKRWIGGWRLVDHNYVLKRDGTPEEIFRVMTGLLDKRQRSEARRKRIESYCGLYPPRKRIG